MNIKFINARILKDPTKQEIIKGDLIVKGNRIFYVGETLNDDKEEYDRVIDCNGNLVMPGFKNAHAHTPMVFCRSLADDMPLHDWLFNKIFPLEDKLTSDDIYELTKLGIAENLTSGITSNFDMYIYPESLSKAAIELGYRTVLLGCLDQFDNEQDMENFIINMNNQSSLVSYRVGFHSVYTCSLDFLNKVRNVAHKLNAPVFAHMCETKDEIKTSLEKWNKTPIEFLDSLDMFKYGGGAFHGVYLTSKEIDICKEKNVAIITNPGSNTKLASGVAPLTIYQQNNILLAIGTDGPSSNNAIDFLREMYLATGLQKLKTEDPSALDAYEVIKMATYNGAKVLGLNECLTLEVGQLADLIMIDLHQPNMQPVNNILKNIVYSCSKQNIKLTMVDGKILYENGNFFFNESIENIYKKCQAITERLNK